MKVALNSPSGLVTFNLSNPQDHISRVIIKNRNWYEFDLLSDIEKRGVVGTAIDVGAHIGNHTLWLAALGYKVVALEPSEESFKQLNMNLGFNVKLATRVIPLPYAAGAGPGSVKVISPNPTNSGMAYCEPGGDISQYAIDDLIDYREPITLVKIDVEGGEIPVLTGARRILEMYQPLLYIEASTAEARTRVDDFLAPYGYELRGRFGKTDTWCYSVAKPATLSISIMAHPKREEMVSDLVDELARQDIVGPIVWDQINNRWDTGRRSMLAYDEFSTHHLVLQDDAVIPPNFIELVKEAIQIPPPDSPLCLYAGRALSRKLRGGALPSWFTMPGVNWGVGIVVPTAHIEEMVAFGDKRREDNYDLRISRYFQSKKILTWYPIPSLVQHRRTPSLVAGRGSRRTAALYVGEIGAQFDPQGPVKHLSWSR